MNHAVPGVASVVDDDVDFTVAELCGLLDERLKILVVEHVARAAMAFPPLLLIASATFFAFSIFPSSLVMVSRKIPHRDELSI